MIIIWRIIILTPWYIPVIEQSLLNFLFNWIERKRATKATTHKIHTTIHIHNFFTIHKLVNSTIQIETPSHVYTTVIKNWIVSQHYYHMVSCTSDPGSGSSPGACSSSHSGSCFDSPLTSLLLDMVLCLLYHTPFGLDLEVFLDQKTCDESLCHSAIFPSTRHYYHHFRSFSKIYSDKCVDYQSETILLSNTVKLLPL